MAVRPTITPADIPVEQSPPEIVGSAVRSRVAPPPPTATIGPAPSVAQIVGPPDMANADLPDAPKLYSDARQALLLHLQGGPLADVPASFVDPVARAFVNKFGAAEPAAVQMLANDMNAVRALTDDQVAERLRNGQPLLKQSGSLLDALSEVAWETGAKRLWAQSIIDREDSVKGAYQQIDGETAAALTKRLQDDTAKIAGTTDNPNRRIMAEQASGGVGISEYSGLPAVWTWDKQQGLVFAAQDVAGGGTLQEVIRLDPGTKIESNLDALEARALAEAGLAHEVVSRDEVSAPASEWVKGAVHKIAVEVESNPLAVKTIDLIGDTMRLQQGRYQEVVTTPNRLESAIAAAPTRREQAAQAARDHFLATGDVEVQYAIDELVAKAADAIQQEQAKESPGGERILAADALQTVNDFMSENPELEQVTRESLADQVLADAQASLENKTVIGESIDTAMEETFAKMQAYDGWVQRKGVNVIDFFADLGYQVEQTVAPSLINDTDMAEGQGMFEKAWAETNPFQAPESPDVADYFKLEGAGADIALFTSAMVFDPINWLFGGSKFASKMMRLAMTDGKFAAAYLRMPWGRKLVTRLTEAEGIDGLRAVMSIEGLTIDQFVELSGLAMEKGVDRKLVEKAVLRTMPSTDGVGFSIVGPGRTRTRNLAKNMQHTLTRLGVVPKASRERIFQSLTALSHTRQVSTAGHGFIDDFFDTLLKIHPEDADVLERWALKAHTTLQDSTLGRDELLAASQARMQRASTTLAELRAGKEAAVSRVDEVVAQLDQIRFDQASAVAAGGDTASLEALAGEEAAAKAAVKEAKSARRTASDLYREARKDATAAARAQYYAMSAETNANQARLVMEFYEEEAKRLGLKRVGALDAFPDIGKYDWSPVTGISNHKIYDRELNRAIGRGESLSGSAAKGRELEDVGVFNKQSSVPVPASPWDIVTYERLQGRPALLAEWQQAKATRVVRWFYGQYRKLFAMNLLLNLFTPTVTNLDEVLRFWAVTGNLGGTLKAAVQAPPFTMLGTKKLAEGVTPYATAYTRDVLGELGRTPGRSWDWIVRPARRASHEYKAQVERFTNGLIGNDDMLREYFWASKQGKITYETGLDKRKWVGGKKAKPSPEFVDWWENGTGTGVPGKHQAVPPGAFIKSGGKASATVSAEDAFALMDNNFRLWLREMVDPSARTALRDRMVEAATVARGTDAGRLTIENDGRLLAAVKKVPGVPTLAAEKGRVGQLATSNWWFESFFGGPSQRRGAIFFDHFFDSAMGMYREAYTRKGTLLTADRLSELLGEQGIHYTRDQAEMLLRRGVDSTRIRGLMRGGYVTESQLEAAAAAYASKRSDELMYTLMSTSLAGTKAEAAMPFARAQMDFIGWWFDWLTRPPIFRVNLQTREALAQSGLGRAALKALEAGESVPLNVRALARYSHALAMANNDYDTSQAPGPDWALDKLTFFPNKKGPEVMMDLLPSPLGAISWLAEGVTDKWDKADVWQAFQDIWPTMQYSEGDSLLDQMFPTTERSLRKVFGTTVRFGAAMTDTSPDAAAWNVAATLTGVRQPPGTSGWQAAGLIDWMRNNANSGRYVEPGIDQWNEEINRLAADGYKKATVREATETLKGQAKASNFDPDAPYLEGYSLLIDKYQMLDQMGVLDSSWTIDEGGKPRLLAVWDKFLNGTADRADVAFLSDTFATLLQNRARDTILAPGFVNEKGEQTKIGEVTLQDVLLAMDPGLAVNMISKLMVNPTAYESGPDGRDFAQKYSDSTDQYRLQNMPPGPTGRDLRREAFNKMWVLARPMNGQSGWAADAQVLANRAKRNLLSNVWVQATGTRWSGSDLSQIRQAQSWTATPRLSTWLSLAGVNIPAGETVGWQDLADMIDSARSQLYSGASASTDLFGAASPVGTHLMHTPEGKVIATYLKNTIGDLTRDDLSVHDLDETTSEKIRNAFSSAVDLGLLRPADYASTYQRYFGALDWQPPEPPPADQLKDGFHIGKDQLNQGIVDVVDGDTLVLHLADDDLRVRLLGINAPELGKDEGAVQATEMLRRMVNSADDITLGLYQQDIFGVQQLSGPGDSRLVAWLYYNGVPVYDETLFTPRDPSGAGVGGEVADLFDLYQRRGGVMPESEGVG